MLNRFRKNSDGSVLIIVALGVMAVVGAVGAAVDIGRGQMVQAKLQNAVDAAGLAAGATLSTADLNDVAVKYINLNFQQNNLGATLGTTTTTLSADKKTLDVHTSATLPTSMMRIFGKTTMAVAANTQVIRSNKGLEVAMVLDTTGSMAGSKIQALKDAAHDLTDILFGANATQNNLWIGVVPFSQSVNIGTGRTAWLTTNYNSGYLWSPTSWGGCVEARYGSGKDITDDPPYDLALPNAVTPAAPYQRLKPYYDTDVAGSWDVNTGVAAVTNNLCSNSSSCTCANYGCVSNVITAGNKAYTISCTGNGNNKSCKKVTTTYLNNSVSGPNAYCPAAITPLTNTKATVDAGINALVAQGNTHINFGAVWGWRMISPRWRGYWGGAMNTNNLPLDYNAPLMSKAVIIMTDGENTTGPYSAYPSSSGVTAANLDTKTTAVCNAMKANGIIVYTILFQQSSAGVKTLLKNCATNPDYFFDSPTEQSLKAAFQTIGDSLANLRISQ